MSRTAVVTINYWRATDTQSCVRSLMASSPVPPIVVVDNSPGDPDLDAALADYPTCQRIDAPDNLGFGRGNNLGIRWIFDHTDCEFVFVLNNDAVVFPDTIRELERIMDDNPDVGMAGPRIVFADDPDKLWFGGGEVSWRRGAALAPGAHGPADAALAMRPRDVSFLSGCAVLIRRRLLEQIGGFDPRFFMYEEDLELCLRAVEAGWRLHYQPTALVAHRGQGSSRREGERFHGRWSPRNPRLTFLVRHTVQNSLLNMHEHAVGRQRLSFRLGYPLFLARKMLILTAAGRFDGVLAVWHGIRGYLEVRNRGFRDELGGG